MMLRYKFWCGRCVISHGHISGSSVTHSDVPSANAQCECGLLTTPTWPHNGGPSETVPCGGNLWQEGPEQRFSCHSPCPGHVTGWPLPCQDSAPVCHGGDGAVAGWPGKGESGQEAVALGETVGQRCGQRDGSVVSNPRQSCAEVRDWGPQCWCWLETSTVSCLWGPLLPLFGNVGLIKKISTGS